MKNKERELTPIEQKEILNYMKANPLESFTSIADVFSKKFKTPITEANLNRIQISTLLQRRRPD